MKQLNTQLKLVNRLTGLTGLIKFKKEFSEICLYEDVTDFDSLFFRNVYNSKLGLFY